MTEEIKEEKKESVTRAVENNFISIDDFQKVEIRVGEVISANPVPSADKLYILLVDLGEETPRQILSGIREFVSVEELIGKQFPFITNLLPRKLRGFDSNGMILAGNDENDLALFMPTKKLKNGTRLR